MQLQACLDVPAKLNGAANERAIIVVTLAPDRDKPRQLVFRLGDHVEVIIEALKRWLHATEPDWFFRGEAKFADEVEVPV